MKLTRREVVVGGVAAVAGCSGFPGDDEGLAASGPEDDDEMSAIPSKYTPSQSFPLHLTATTTLQANSVGGVNAVSLANPLGGAMEILEIKWQLQQSFASGNFPDSTGCVVGCKLDLGKFALSNGYVPVAMFCRSENLVAERMVASSSIGSAVGISNNEYTWKLPRPLYVPRGAVVVPTFQHRGVVSSDISVRISYSARSIADGAPAPKKVSLPYAAFWGSPTIEANTAGTGNSTETDIVNPFSEVLHLQRMAGRTLTSIISGGNLFIAETSGDTAASLATIRIVDSFGRPIIKRFVPFRSVFPLGTQSWEMPGAVMDPKSFMTVYLNKTAGSFYNDNTCFQQVFISAVGWRDVVGGVS